MRPIDADKLQKDIQDKATHFPWLSLTAFLDYIDNTPTLEMRPIIHAYWIIETKPFSTYQCSNCKEYADEVYDYCPKCSAVMDERRKYKYERNSD